MTINEKQQLTRAGSKYALLCALFGLLIAAVIAAIFFAGVGIGLHEMILIIPQPIAVAVFALFASAFVLGRGSGNLIYRFGVRSIVTPVMSVLLAFACAVTATAAGVETGVMAYNSPEPFSIASILQLKGTIVGIGSAPAAVLGLGFWAMIRSSVRSHHSSHDSMAP
jgi:hypothetical protein